MHDGLWEIVSRDLNDVFGVMRGDETRLVTSALRYYLPIQILQAENGEAYGYQSRLITRTSNEHIRFYKTIEEAKSGHYELAKKYNLR